ncbi:unnamed protein product [Symbiodinium sp. CCMP2456]|nr:unnamed protein product [Symbiodinium sp. CCMP2456]
MDGSVPDSGGLSWYYLDSVQKEFGPFAQATMRDWFTQGFFPNGEELLIRLPHWERHVALKMVWPDVSEAFQGMPRSSPPGPPTQVGEVEGFDPYGDLQSIGTRRPSEESPYLAADMSQMGGCSFWGANGVDGGAVGNGVMGIPGELLDGVPMSGGMRPINSALGMSGGMQTGGMPGNVVAMSTMPRMVQGAPGTSTEAVMAQGCAVDGQGQFAYPGFGQGMILQPMQTFPGAQLHLVPVASAAAGNNTRFRGRIKSFNAKQGFGFIENSEAFAIFGRDVFLHKAQIGNLKVGTEADPDPDANGSDLLDPSLVQVTYTVEMNKFGMPQARDLATLDGKPPGPPPASVAKGGAKPRPSAKKKPKDEDGANPRKPAPKAGSTEMAGLTGHLPGRGGSCSQFERPRSIKVVGPAAQITQIRKPKCRRALSPRAVKRPLLPSLLTLLQAPCCGPQLT